MPGLIGAAVEMIEVDEPPPLADDEVLLDVMAAAAEAVGLLQLQSS